ncbi:MAG: hypothetical protein MZV70_60140 [Desulfobacterales bacterium]|nr:hypothetical protein [Desulfobacterales bacterium]
MVSSLAAVAKAAALLIKGYVDLQPFVAFVEADVCTWCGKCQRRLPLRRHREGRPTATRRWRRWSTCCARAAAPACRVCPLDATQLKGYTDEQIEAMIDVLAREAAHEG